MSAAPAPAPATAATSPILRALAHLRPAFSAAQSWKRLLQLVPLPAFALALAAFCARCTPRLAGCLRAARKAVREHYHPRRRALLIGIQKIVELPDEASAPAAGAGADGLHPHLARSQRKKRRARKKKNVAVQQALRGPHHDVECMRAVLIDKYGYHPDDIVCLVDDENPAHVQPTRDNIIAQIRALVHDVRDGDRLFFHYAGHADQMDTDSVEEEDGKNECILTSDGHVIMDDELKKELVDAVRTLACTLTAVLDCCHSGSLLDLPHIHCNDVYVPWLNKGRRRTKTLWARSRRAVGVHLADTLSTEPNLDAVTSEAFTKDASRKSTGLSIDTSPYPTPQISREPSYSGNSSGNVPVIDVELCESSPPPDDGLREFVSPGSFVNSPAALFKYCDGFCRDDMLANLSSVEDVRAEVVCISASKDGELSWEDGDGRSMTRYLVDNLMVNPHPTLRNLLTKVSHDIHQYYVSDLHGRARSFKKELSSRGMRQEGDTASIVEMHNFQNPQMSSFLPLDMELSFEP